MELRITLEPACEGMGREDKLREDLPLKVGGSFQLVAGAGRPAAFVSFRVMDLLLLLWSSIDIRLGVSGLPLQLNISNDLGTFQAFSTHWDSQDIQLCGSLLLQHIDCQFWITQPLSCKPI